MVKKKIFFDLYRVTYETTVIFNKESNSDIEFKVESFSFDLIFQCLTQIVKIRTYETLGCI